MKKLFLTAIAAVVFAAGAGAQDFGKGDWTLNANISRLNLAHSFGSKTTDLNLGAGAGYFILDRLAVDANLGLDLSKTKGSPGYSAFSFGAGVRYYPWQNLFARVGYNGLASKGASTLSYAAVAVGYDWFFTDNVYFEPSIGYTRQLAKGGSNNLGLGLGIGVKF